MVTLWVTGLCLSKVRSICSKKETSTLRGAYKKLENDYARYVAQRYGADFVMRHLIHRSGRSAVVV